MFIILIGTKIMWGDEPYQMWVNINTDPNEGN